MNERHAGQPCPTHTLYRMDCAEYDALLARAGGCCEACGIPREESPRRTLVIDHDHRYGVGAVRGILCMPCNSMLGALDNAANSVNRILCHPKFGRYVSSAWHMQVVQWARTQDSMLGHADHDTQTLNASVLRFPAVRWATKHIGHAPTVTSRWVAHPGYTGLRVKAAYSIKRAYCALHLQRGGTATLSLDRVEIAENGEMTASVSYADLSAARGHIAKLVSAA